MKRHVRKLENGMLLLSKRKTNEDGEIKQGVIGVLE
jgi:hypothetical protein